MGIICGIVGLPTGGKSTRFYALTKAGIAVANFPFCPIETNVGEVPAPEPRVGPPNVVKSTLFDAPTKAGIAAANCPFCTIEPNVGVVPVPDPRLGQLARIVKPQKVLPTVMEFVDSAGLVAGASSGEGLGNKF